MTEFMTANTINDMFRSLFALLDKVAYWLLGIMYEILFNVASADIFSNETIKNFYGRIQLIIGEFMIFKLAISIIQGIINPDTFTDKKTGFSNMITRVIFALVMLTVITPINIPSAQTEYEIQLNNNGLLFGTLYSLQYRILTNNTLGKLILGTVDTSQTTTTGDSTMSQADKQAQKLQESANAFTSAILKGFVRINMKEGETDETKYENRVCSGIDNEKEIIETYAAYDASPNEILALVNISCETDDENKFWLWDILDGGDSYMFAYMPIISTVVAVVFIYILLGEIITIAIRTIKLAVLRLLAPIPIISYIDPKSEKDGAFGSWVKSLTSTYLELFLHLAVIYFIIFLIQDMSVNGIVINTGSGIIGIISMIFIWIGMFFFIKQAPKFIKDILGIKGSSANVGLAGVLGGAAALFGGAGIAGAAAASMNAMDGQVQAYNSGKALPLGGAWGGGRDLAAQIKTGDPKAKGGWWNNLNDRLVREAGVRSAERNYGVTANGLAMAKNNMLNASAAASLAEDQYTRFARGYMSDAERDEYVRNNGISTTGTREEQNERIRQHMYDNMSKAQTRASKAKSHYEDAKKFADSHRVTPSFEEEHRRSVAERFGFGQDNIHRDDYVAESGRRTAHQTMSDRIAGSPDDWREPDSPRTDNRWNPGKYNDTDNNDIHDTPGWTDTPGGGGPGRPRP